MKVRINHNKLTDSPYSGRLDDIFIFNEANIQNFISELRYGNQTCYLISGYRGSGKTSFINRVNLVIEQDYHRANYVENKRKKVHKLAKDKAGNELLPDSYELVFVRTSFAKYVQTAFLRQLIRNLYLAFQPGSSNSSDKLVDLEKSIREEFTSLYTRTFYDVKSQIEQAQEEKSETTFTLDGKLGGFLKGILNLIAPVSVSLVTYFLDSSVVPVGLKLLIVVLLVAWAFVGIFQIKSAWTRTKTKSDKVSATEIYDDEIAFYRFEKILIDLKKCGFKVVFVLDELDKVDEKITEKLINEMKPYLLSGLADFIVVAGQQIMHKYLASLAQDDAVMSSLFSKTMHISLKDTKELKGLVLDHLVMQGEKEFSTEEMDLIKKYFRCLIFQARRTPRILFNMIRQNLMWEGDKAYLDIKESAIMSDHDSLIDIIEEHILVSVDKEGHEPAVKDYLIVQLFRTASIILASRTKAVNIKNVISEIQTQNTYHKFYSPRLVPHLVALIYKLKDIWNFEFEEDGLFYKLNSNKNESSYPPVNGSGTPDVRSNIDQQPKEDDELIKNELLNSFREELADFTNVITSTDRADNLDNNNRIIHALSGFNGLTSALVKDEVFLKFIRNQSLLEENRVASDFYKHLQEKRIDLSRISRAMLEKFVNNELSGIFDNSQGWSISNSLKDLGVDFLIHNSKNKKSPDLLVQFKYYQKGSLDIDISQVLRTLTRYNNNTKKGNYLLLIILSAKSDNSFEIGAKNYELQMHNINKFLSPHVFILTRSLDLLNTINEFLSDVRSKMKKYSTVIDYSKGKPILYKDDLQKGRWGGSADRNGRKLSCTKPKRNQGKYSLELLVTTTSTDRPLLGTVIFFLHDSYPDIMIPVEVQDGTAVLEIQAHEAFTVGAVADDGETELELDLSQLPDAPKEFISNDMGKKK